MDDEPMEIVEIDEPGISIAEILSAVRSGQVFDQIHLYDDSLLRNFVPFLVSQTAVASLRSDCKLTLLRQRLNRFTSATNYIELTEDVDFGKLIEESKELASKDASTAIFLRTKFSDANTFTKLKIIATYILHKSLHQTTTPTESETFQPFCSETEHDEVITILIILFSYFGYIIKPLDVIRLLLHQEEGIRIFQSIVLNVPSLNLFEVVNLLLENASGDESEQLKKQRKSFLWKLLHFNSQLVHQTLRLISDDLDSRLPLFIDILTKVLPVREFIVESLRAITNNDRRFMVLLKRSTYQKQTTKFLNRLDCVIQDALKAMLQKPPSPSLVVLVASVLCSNLQKLIGGDKVNSWIKFLTYFHSSLSEQYLQTALCAICACNLSSTVGSQFESSVTNFFHDLRLHVSSDLTRFDGLRQLMLLLAIHFSTTNDEQVNYLLSSTLTFQVTASIRQSKTSTLYLRHAMTESDLATSGAKISVTPALTADTCGFLPAHCINHLLQGKKFSKNNVEIKSWIQRQLMQCRTPVHPIMADLLRSYAVSCIPSVDVLTCNNPLDDSFLSEVFSGDPFDPSKRATRLLSLHFIFAYTLEHHGFMINNCHERGWHRHSYWDSALVSIPLRYFLCVMASDPTNYQPIRTDLACKVAYMMPYMLPTLDALTAGKESFLDYKTDIYSKRVTNEKLISVFSQISKIENNSTICRMLSYLENASLQTLSKLQPGVAYAMKACLDPLTPGWVVDIITGVWKRLEVFQPRRLYEATIKQWTTVKNITSKHIVEQPLLLYRCDTRIFRSYQHLKCLLSMTQFYTSSFASNANSRKERARVNDGEPDDRLDLMHALTGAQNSTIIQVLISLCDNASEQIQRVIGDHIHHMFIEEPNVCRLVHYQTYPLHLIPVVVKFVPSMHIMIDYIQELLVNAKLRRRIFGIVLVAELSFKYKISKALDRVELMLDVVNTLVTYVSTDYNVALFLAVVPSLARLMSIYPLSPLQLPNFSFT